MPIHIARSLLVGTTECLKRHTVKYTGNVTWELISSSKFRNAWVYTSTSPIVPSWHGWEQLYIGWYYCQ